VKADAKAHERTGGLGNGGVVKKGVWVKLKTETLKEE
jgi:hypothetical protein